MYTPLSTDGLCAQVGEAGPYTGGFTSRISKIDPQGARTTVVDGLPSSQANGVGGFLKHLFGPKGETSGIIKVLMVVIFFVVGWLEVISILFRPIALSFRLFGNVYAGESILEAMSTMIPWLSPILPIPFYFLEVLVGFVQAMVFMLLTAVFTMLIAEHQEEPERAH